MMRRTGVVWSGDHTFAGVVDAIDGLKRRGRVTISQNFVKE